jgi:hypothetical protein
MEILAKYEARKLFARCLKVSLMIALPVTTSLVNHPFASAAAPGCPDASKISAAIGKPAEDKSEGNTCTYDIGFGDVTITFAETSDAKAAFSAKRAEAAIRKPPLTKIKVGKFPGFTNAAQGQARLTYNQNKVPVYLAHFEVSVRSANLLKSLGIALSKITVPKTIKDCSKVSATVTKTIPDAKFDDLQNSTCTYTLADSSQLFVGTSSDYTYAELLELNQELVGGIEEFTVNGKAAFVYQYLDAIAIVNLGDRIATVEYGGLGTEGAVKVAKLLG